MTDRERRALVRSHRQVLVLLALQRFLYAGIIVRLQVDPRVADSALLLLGARAQGREVSERPGLGLLVGLLHRSKVNSVVGSFEE